MSILYLWGGNGNDSGNGSGNEGGKNMTQIHEYSNLVAIAVELFCYICITKLQHDTMAWNANTRISGRMICFR